MLGFDEGYNFFAENSAGVFAGISGNQYINEIGKAIDSFTKDLNSFEGYKTSAAKLKGDIAEFWAADTFNIDAALNDSKNRAFVNRSHDFASVDISTNFGHEYGSKFDATAVKSAKEQAKSVFERFKDYQTRGGKESLEEFLSNRGFSDDVVLDDPIYSGQYRIIPTDQMRLATKWLEDRIQEEAKKRPEQVHRYEETLELLRDRIKDNEGNESIPLTREEAERLAQLSKEGKIDPEEIGLSMEDLVTYKHILKKAFKAGTTAAIVSMVLKVAPEIMKAIECLAETGEIDKNQFKKIGFAALSGSTEGFVTGTLSAAIAACCETGILGEALQQLDPTIIGTVTVLAYNTMKNAFNVAIGKMTKTEMANELIKQMFTSTCALVVGSVTQSIIEIPVLGFMIGNFVGSLAGSFIYNVGYKGFMSFCTATGFTMFGLVEQDYELPEDVMKEIGVEVFEYDKYEREGFEHSKFEFNRFNASQFNPNIMDVKFLRRGVIGVSKIGYV